MDKKKFMLSIKGDSGETILDRTSRRIGSVDVESDRDGYAVNILEYHELGREFVGSAKTLKAALRGALVQWADSTDDEDA